MVATQILWNENGEISGLGRLERLLSRLKKYGFRNARSDEVWDDVPVEAVEWSIPSYSPSITQDDLPRLRRSLNEAKLCMAVLDKVRDYLGRRIRFVRKACMSLVLENGINTMPDEILSLIFEACHRMTDGWTFARCVRQVSWRFRQVSYQTPLLWTRFSPDLSDSQVQAFIARSGGMDLEVSTDWSIPEVEDKLLHTLCPHSKRWSSLKLESPSTASVMNMLDMVSFPRLEYLDLHGRVNIPQWELPSLSRIRVHNPQYRLGFSFQSQLTSVTLSLFEQDVDFRLLAHTLRGMTSMRHLFLTLDECREVQKFGIRMELRDTHTIMLETLQITIKASPEGYRSDDYQELYYGLSCYNALTVDIALEFRAGDDPRLYTMTNMCDGDMFPYGSTVRIRVSTIGSTCHSWRGFRLLTQIMENCNIAHTVDIEVPMVSIIDVTSNDWDCFASLRHLRLRRCDGLNEGELRKLVDKLIISPTPGMGLESLEILQCPGISEEFLLDLSDEAGPKLKWKM